MQLVGSALMQGLALKQRQSIIETTTRYMSHNGLEEMELIIPYWSIEEPLGHGTFVRLKHPDENEGKLAALMDAAIIVNGHYVHCLHIASHSFIEGALKAVEKYNARFYRIKYRIKGPIEFEAVNLREQEDWEDLEKVFFKSRVEMLEYMSMNEQYYIVSLLDVDKEEAKRVEERRLLLQDIESNLTTLCDFEYKTTDTATLKTILASLRGIIDLQSNREESYDYS